MFELLFNQLAITLPIHFFAYASFPNQLRFGKKKTFVLVSITEMIWLVSVVLLYQAGLPLSVIQLFAIPLFGGLFFLAVKMVWGKILFFYIFNVAYEMALRGTAIFLWLLYYPNTTYTTCSLGLSILIFILFFLTIPVMLFFIHQMTRVLIEIDAPQIWNRVWLLPLFNTFLVFLFTYPTQKRSSVSTSFLLARILLLICMFIFYYFILHSVEQFRQQLAAQEDLRHLEQLTRLQTAQYALLQSRVEETRRIRHDLRQHLNAIQGYIDAKDLVSLSSYLQLYRQTIPQDIVTNYCQNHAVNSILGLYAEQAANNDISMNISFCAMPVTPIPEPEFCVLLGNLLENALEACCHTAKESSIPLSIFVRAQKPGNHMLFLTVDNTCPLPPVQKEGHFLSRKHPGSGIGTESVLATAKKYHGDARFEWKEGIFLASVMLNADCSDNPSSFDNVPKN